MESRHTNIRVGLFVTIGFIVLVGLFTWKSGALVKFSGYEVIGEFDNVGGLLESSDVRYRGYTVGKVMAIVPGPKSILVYAKIRSSIQIPRDSKFRIAFDGLIGQKFVSVLPGVADEPIKTGDHIPGIAAAGIVDFIDEGAKSMQEVQKVLAHIRVFLESGTLQTRINNSAQNMEIMTAQLKDFGPKMNTVVDQLNALIVSLRKMTEDSDNQNNVKQILVHTNEATDRLNKVMTSLEAITGDQKNQENIQAILQNLKDISEDLKGVTGNASSGGLSQGVRSVSKLANTRVGVDAALLAYPEQKLASGRAGINVKYGNANYRLGVKEDSQTRSMSLYSLTGERPLGGPLSCHVGIIDSQLGAGVGYNFDQRIRLVAEAYQPSQLKANVQVSYAIDPRWRLITAAERIQAKDSDVYVGLGYRQ